MSGGIRLHLDRDLIELTTHEAAVENGYPTRGALINGILRAYLRGCELLVIGPPPLTTTLHTDLHSALLGLAAAATEDWIGSADGENRRFTSDSGRWASITKLSLIKAQTFNQVHESVMESRKE